MESIITNVIQDIVNKTVDSITEIVGQGSVNQIFIVTTGKEKLVIRLNNNRGIDEYIKEKWCIEQSAAKGVLGPTVHKLGEIEGYSYMVQSFLEGAVATHEKINTISVWEEVGKYAKQIHTIPVVGFGLNSNEFIESDTNTSEEKLREFVTYNITSLTPEDKLIALGVLDKKQSVVVRRLFEELLQKKFTFGLNHGDLSLKNIMVSPDNAISVFDWGSAEAHIVPHHDFGEILKSSIRRESAEFKAFMSGYGLSEDDFAGMIEDIYTIMLLRSIDKLRWAIDKSPQNVPQFIENVKEIYLLKFK